jgi:predicted Zn-dependent protease
MLAPGFEHLIGTEPRPPLLPLERGKALLEHAASRIGRLQPGAVPRLRWSAMDQVICIAGAGKQDSRDHRRGAWLRIELARPRGVGAPGAVVELALPRAWEREEPGSVVESLVAQVSARFEERHAARPIEDGEYEVVLAPGLGGILAHEVVGHALEGDTLAAGLSWLGRRAAGEAVAPPGLSVVDDPRRARVAWRIDDEGPPSRPAPLILEGRLAGRLHDRTSAARAGEAPTGHGRRTSYRESPRPRMGCTFIGAGRLQPGQVLSEVASGVYVRRMEAAATDTTTGRASFRVTDADRIVKGRIEAPLLPFVIQIDGPRLLASLAQVADDLAFDTCIGMCMRDGQPLATSVGGPTVRLGPVSVLAGSSVELTHRD